MWGGTSRLAAALGLGLLAVAIPREGRALNACKAADVIAQDPGCPATGACSITKAFDVGDGCQLIFGNRAITIQASGEVDIGSGTVRFSAGNLTVVPGARMEGRGTSSSPPGDRGGFLTVAITGNVDIQQAGNRRGTLDFSGRMRGGTVLVDAGGNVTVSGTVIANQLTNDGGNGSVTIRADGDLVTGSGSDIGATGGSASSGGFVDLVAGGRISLGALVDVRGGEGGSLDVSAGTQAVVRQVDGTGGGDAGSGGCVNVVAGTRADVLDEIKVDGTGSSTNSGGGCGGFVCIESGHGNTTVSARISAESGAPDGGGGGIEIISTGSIAALADVSARGNGQLGCGGDVTLEAALDVQTNGVLDVSGGFGGSGVDITAGRNVTINGTIDARGRDTGGFGGEITVLAGDVGAGNVVITSVVDAGGGACGPYAGCGLGGSIDVEGCDVTVSGAGSLLARGAEGGDTDLTARELLTVQGTVDVTSTEAMSNGVNSFRHPSRRSPVLSGTVSPPASVQTFATCATPGQSACLVPCPTCGNGVTEFPETCDQAGTPQSCDGCSLLCRTESCNDGNPCTSDSCTPSLGCQNTSVANGTQCPDGDVCNGGEACFNGTCRVITPPPNCNDANVCTADSCDPGLGCQNVPTPAGGPCSDNSLCTSDDACDGAGTCRGTPPLCDDGVECTLNSCNPATGACVFPPAPNGTPCEDEAFCTVSDTCQGGTCDGVPRNCSDGDVCSQDSCDEVADECVSTGGGSCCGDGVADPGEECDDGDADNTDACLDSCELASCGDGFVRAVVEECDAGVGNSNAPNAACRTNCTVQRCSDGIVDDQRGEQCDDGALGSGDGCSDRCFIEPSATTALIPGRGSRRKNCALGWRMESPALDRSGIPSIKQACSDGDPACDVDATPGECRFHVWSCSNNNDPNVPLCAPGLGGVGVVESVRALRPSTRDAGRRPEDAANREELLRTAAAAVVPTPDTCGPRMTIRVPLKTPQRRGLRLLKHRGVTSTGARDTDVLKLFCLP